MYKDVPCYAILAAGGSGLRAGFDLPKQFMELKGKTVIARSFELFEDNPFIDGVITVVVSGFLDTWKSISSGYKKKLASIPGGQDRQESVYLGLKELGRIYTDRRYIVLIHDAARPLTEQDIINASIEAAYEYGGAVAAVPASETVKCAADGFVSGTPDRAALFFAQTPQAFRFGKIMKAHESARAAGFIGYDDATLAERLNMKVKIILGSYENIKITSSGDLIRAELILKAKTNVNIT